MFDYDTYDPRKAVPVEPRDLRLCDALAHDMEEFTQRNEQGRACRLRYRDRAHVMALLAQEVKNRRQLQSAQFGEAVDTLTGINLGVMPLMDMFRSEGARYSEEAFAMYRALYVRPLPETLPDYVLQGLGVLHQIGDAHAREQRAAATRERAIKMYMTANATVSTVLDGTVGRVLALVKARR